MARQGDMKNISSTKVFNNIFGNFTVAKKVFAIVSISIFMLITVSIFSISQTAQIGHEISTISETDMPLSTGVAKINELGLDQAIVFERALRYGSLIKTEPQLLKKFEKLVKKFEEDHKLISSAIESVSTKLKSSLQTPLPDNHKKTLLHMQEELAEIAKVQHEYTTNADKALGYLKANNMFAASTIIPDITKKQDKLKNISKVLLQEINKLTIKTIKNTEEHEKHLLLVLSILSVGAVIISLSLAWYFISKSISKPLTTITSALTKLANEDTSVNLEINSSDEIGQVATAYKALKEQLIASQKLRDEQKAIKEQAEIDKQNTMLEIAERFENSIGHIVSIMASTSEELSSTATNITEIVVDTNSKATNVSTASIQASANVQSVASATEEMSHSIAEINRQITDASSITQKAVTEAENTSTQMSTLTSTANKIEEVVSFISEIADQTNLLALNATIESARAGDAGKGFAVVAAEVKALAKDTTKATEDIVDQIKQIQEAIKHSVNSVNQVGDAIKEIDDTSSSIASVMEQQGSATQEISRNVQEAAIGSDEVNEGIQGISRASKETGDSISNVASAAIELSKQTASLQNEVNVFLVGLREGPADRRATEDLDYTGPERRAENQQRTLAA